jgi:poly(A) polymerase
MMSVRVSRKAEQDLTQLKPIYAAFHGAGKQLYLVGGAVRDLALGVALEQLDDLDFCTDARPQETLAILKQHGFSTYEMGIAFGTVGAVIRGPKDKGYPKDCQVTTYRSAEFYRRGSRHPEVSFGDTIYQDLWRRDFSINSIAMDADGVFVDPYDGLGDLEAGVLRVVSDPRETLAEDPLRILRIGRFISKLGFAPSASLKQAASERAEHIMEISRERWLQEMSKLLVGVHARAALEFLREVRILSIILPELDALWRHPAPAQGARGAGELWARTLERLEQVPREAGLRWAALLSLTGMPWCGPDREAPPDGAPERAATHAAMLAEAVMPRFRADNALSEEVDHLIRWQGALSRLPDPEDRPALRRFVRTHGKFLEPLLAFVEAIARVEAPDKEAAKAHIKRAREVIEAERLAGTLVPELPAGVGKAVMEAWGLRPGPLVGEIKAYLEERILDGTLENRRGSDYYVASLKVAPPDFLLQPSNRPS